MKYFLPVIILSFSIGMLQAKPKQDTLTNDKVISLLNAGIPPALVVTKIKTSIASFDISTDGLTILHSKGVPSEVINAMINPNSEPSSDAQDSVSIYKKWKMVSNKRNGELQKVNYDFRIQYFKDQTYKSVVLFKNSNQSQTHHCKFELTNQQKSITHFPEKTPEYTMEIINLTKTELEMKGIINGDEYDTVYNLDEDE